MYSVYIDDELIFSPVAVSLGYSISLPVITMEINKAGSFEFTVPTTNPMYNSMQKLKSTVTVIQDGKEIWRGRILEIDRDFYNNRTVFCEGELNFLNDILYPPTFSTGGIVISEFRGALQYYNDRCSENRKILMGDITAVDPQSHYPGFETEEYTPILEELTFLLLDNFGGYFKLRRENGSSYLDYKSISENISDQAIRFGENLLDLNEYIDASEVYTYLYPMGGFVETPWGETVRVSVAQASGNDGKTYVYSESGEQLFGRIERCIIYDDIKDADSLLQQAKINLNSAIEESMTIEIKALDLVLLGVNVAHLEVGMQVLVVSLPHKLNDYFLCSKIKLNLDDPSQSVYTFGMTPNTLTARQSDTASTANSAYSIASDSREESLIYYVTKTEFNFYKNSIQNELDVINNDLETTMRYKGDVASVDLLPKEENKIGDTYNVNDTDENYTWNGVKWDKL